MHMSKTSVETAAHLQLMLQQRPDIISVQFRVLPALHAETRQQMSL